jgi:predicted metal-dependent phosphotriesterase family hydrolase
MKLRNKKVYAINDLCNGGFEDKILLSHDALVYNGFNPDLTINETPRFPFVFDNILPKLSNQLAQKIMIENPIKMLKCGE